MEENAKASVLPIIEVYMCSPDYISSVEIDPDESILKFPFSWTMTEEELKENAGEPTGYREYTSDDGDYTSTDYYYKQDSTMYYSDYGYHFEYANGKLDYVTMDWLP